jgi:uncharacterized protein (DUF433 family)
MTTQASLHPTIVRTDRGLTLVGTRITFYDLMDYITAGWPPQLIRDRLGLTDRQIQDAMSYLDEHRTEVEEEYRQVLLTAEENRQYWEDRNRERLEAFVSSPSTSDKTTLYEKLAAWKAKHPST